jgi:hypothetical protein
MNNPKVNYTKEDIENYVYNLFVKLIIDKDHPEIKKRAKKLTKKFIKQNVDN